MSIYSVTMLFNVYGYLYGIHRLFIYNIYITIKHLKYIHISITHREKCCVFNPLL